MPPDDTTTPPASTGTLPDEAPVGDGLTLGDLKAKLADRERDLSVQNERVDSLSKELEAVKESNRQAAIAYNDLANERSRYEKAVEYALVVLPTFSPKHAAAVRQLADSGEINDRASIPQPVEALREAIANYPGDRPVSVDPTTTRLRATGNVAQSSVSALVNGSTLTKAEVDAVLAGLAVGATQVASALKFEQVYFQTAQTHEAAKAVLTESLASLRAQFPAVTATLAAFNFGSAAALRADVVKKLKTGGSMMEIAGSLVSLGVTLLGARR